jgi:hypothetical protein
LKHEGVLGTILLPVLTEEATAPLPAMTLRVPTFLFPVPEQAMRPWRSKEAVDSSVDIAISSAMARTLLDFLPFDINQGQSDPPPIPQGVKSAIRSIATDLHNGLGEAMATAKSIFSHTPAALIRGTLPNHFWSESVRHDVDDIRRRVKTLRLLASLVARNLESTISDTSPHIAIWQEVHTPVSLHMDPSPPPRDLACLGFLHHDDLVTIDDTTPKQSD